MKDEQDSEDIHMTSNEPLISKGGAGAGQCHQDLLIYWTQWSIDQDDLFDECLNICATFYLRWSCSIFPLFRQAKHFLLSPTPNSQKSTTHHPFNLSDQRHSRSVHKLNGGQARQSCPTHQHQHSRPTHKVHSWLLLAQQPNHRSKRLERTPLAVLRWRHCQ